MRFKKKHSTFPIKITTKTDKVSENKYTARLLILFSLVLLILGANTDLSHSEDVDYLATMGVIRLKEMIVAPDFTLSDLQGDKWSLRDFKGKFVMLNFWATW